MLNSSIYRYPLLEWDLQVSVSNKARFFFLLSIFKEHKGGLAKSSPTVMYLILISVYVVRGTRKEFYSQSRKGWIILCKMKSKC